MPHQAVTRREQTTAKISVLFNATSHERSAKSLNDKLKINSNLNPDFQSPLLKLHLHQVALVADIEKAFLQIEIAEHDRNVLRFFWLFKEIPMPSNPQVWRMRPITFGARQNTFLLAATLKHNF